MTGVKCRQCGMVNFATATSCKRCAEPLNHSGAHSHARQAISDTSYPKARLPHDAKAGELIKPCIQCGRELGLNRWDSWNGFLVQCPHCGGLHGKRWNIRRVLLASFLFNAFSFLFTMRLRNALISLSGFIVLVAVGNYLLDNDKTPFLLEIFAGIVFILGPMIINAIVLIVHERDLDNSAPPTQALRT